MSGIYLHIPYCKQKCHYCNFYSLASVKYRDELVPAMIRELKLQKGYLDGEPVSTIYLGGGTPSLLTAEEVAKFHSVIHELFEVTPDAEITLEANPDDLTSAKLKCLKHAGVNRLSLGVQSFEDADLKYLNRIHTGKQAYNCVKRSQDAGFSNLSIDLIYGIPTLDSTQWESNLMTALSLGIPHISAYALTVEEKTPLAVMIRKGELPDVNDAVQAQHFNLLIELLEAHGYLHYEISNFCEPGMYARHNTSYWKGISYLGIGPSAHSFNGSSRQWNVANLGQYIQALQKGEVPFEKEILSSAQRFNEYVMTSLRTLWGCDLSIIEKQFGREWMEQALLDAEKYISNGLLKTANNILYLTREGKFRADGIAAQLFRVEHVQ
jgi:oxygen-independent coproporphyrinogen-3 oxidase